MSKSFWDTQPVASRESIDINISNERIQLPMGLEWHETSDVIAITEFLKKYYVEDTDSLFRLSYSEDFFNFMFSDPLHNKNFSLSIINKSGIIGYILAKPQVISINSVVTKIVGVNFLCIDPEFRKLGIAPLLIKEITRISNIHGIFKAVFTGQKDYGFSIGNTCYYHLPLDPIKLYKTGWITTHCNIKSKLFSKIRDSTRKAENIDFSEILKIYSKKYLSYRLTEVFDENSIKYALSCRDNVIQTLYNPDHGEFVSFFIIDTYCIKKNESFKVAYLYYWAGSDDIILDAISYARNIGISLFNFIDIGANMKFIIDYDLLEGSGMLYYHLFNIKSSYINSSDLNFIMY